MFISEANSESDSTKFKTNEEIRDMVEQRRLAIKLKGRKKRKPIKTEDAPKPFKRRHKKAPEGLEAVFMKNKRGTILKDPVEGFQYIKDKFKGNKWFWKCRWVRQLKCKGTCATQGFCLVSRGPYPHNHSTSADPRAHISEFQDTYISGSFKPPSPEDNDKEQNFV